MIVEDYDKVGTISVLLNKKIDELKLCSEERETILNYINDIANKGELRQNADVINAKMLANLQRLQKVVAEIKAINQM